MSLCWPHQLSFSEIETELRNFPNLLSSVKIKKCIKILILKSDFILECFNSYVEHFEFSLRYFVQKLNILIRLDKFA